MSPPTEFVWAAAMVRFGIWHQDADVRFRVPGIWLPGFAQRTGSHAASFPASERKCPVWFEYPWAEEDRVTIKVPKGFDLESAESQTSFGLGAVGE